jgi:hypothetical protein
VSAIGSDGHRRSLLRSEADHFRTGTLAIDDFGASLLLVTTPAEGQPKPMTLVRFVDDGSERYDLEFLFDGAGAMAIDSEGDVFLHQPDDGAGRGLLLRLRHERILNIPGFRQAIGGQGIGAGGIEIFAVLPAAPAGGVYVALRGSRDIILLRDSDGDGMARGALEQRRLAKTPEAPIALAATADGVLYAATEANRIYRIDGNSATLVAKGFGPMLLDLAPAADSGLLVLEGDAQGGRLLALGPAPPNVAAWPQELDFGAAPLGVSIASTVVLRNDGPRAIWVSSETSGQALSAGERVHLDPGEARQLETTWTPWAPGVSRAELLWRDDGGRVLVRLPVAIHGVGEEVGLAGGRRAASQPAIAAATVSKPVQRGDRHPARSARSSVRRACRA